MWKMFEKGQRKANPKGLEEFVDKLIHMEMQKSAGQLRRDNKGDLSFDCLPMLKWSIVCEACYMVLDERWEQVKKIFEERE